MEELETQYLNKRKEIHTKEEQLQKEKKQTLQYCESLFDRVNHYLGRITDDRDLVFHARNHIGALEEEYLSDVKQRKRKLDNLYEDNENNLRIHKQKVAVKE